MGCGAVSQPSSSPAEDASVASQPELVTEPPTTAAPPAKICLSPTFAPVAVVDMDGDGDVDEDDIKFAAEMGRLMAAAVSCEERVTSLLLEVAASSGGELSGLDWKFKTKESLQRSICTRINELAMKAFEEGDQDTDVDIVAAVWMTQDVLRYTMLLPTDSYTAGVLEALARMKEAGFEEIQLKNFWQDHSTYKGINDVFGVPCHGLPHGNLMFELQFHTPEGFENKTLSHRVYEEYRMEDDPEKKLVLWEKRVEWANKVQEPLGVRDIPKPKFRVMPGEAQLFAELAVKRALKLQEQVEAKLSAAMGSDAVSVSSSVAAPSHLESLLNRMVDPNDEIDDTLELKGVIGQLYRSLVVRVMLADGNAYAAAARGAIDALVALPECTVKSFSNGWSLATQTGPGITLNCTMPGIDDGVDFTNDNAVPFAVDLHTPKSAAVQDPLQQAMKKLEGAETFRSRKEAQARARALCESVPEPLGASALMLRATAG